MALDKDVTKLKKALDMVIKELKDLKEQNMEHEIQLVYLNKKVKKWIKKEKEEMMNKLKDDKDLFDDIMKSTNKTGFGQPEIIDEP